MSPTAAATILVIFLSTQVFAAPYICTTCQTSNTQRIYQTDTSHSSGTDSLSQPRLENLEDLTQQAESVLGTSRNDQLAFDNTRPGDWTDVNRYRTPDGHGQVYEEQGQRVNGPTRVRFYRRNFTSSYSSGNLGGVETPDLSGFGSHDRRGSSQLAGQRLSTAQQLALNQAASQGSYGQTGSSTFRQTTAHGNSYDSQGVLNPTIGSSGYKETSSSTFRGGSTLGSQSLDQGAIAVDQQRPGNYSTVNSYRTDGGNGRVWEERGQVVTGPTRVQYVRKNYTSSHSSGGTIPTIDGGVGGQGDFERVIDQFRRQFDSQGREIHQITQGPVNGGYFRHEEEYNRRTGSPVDQTNHRYVSGADDHESQNRVTSGSNVQRTYEFHRGHDFDNDHHHRHHHTHEHSTDGFSGTSGSDSEETQQIMSGAETEAVGPIDSHSGNRYGNFAQSQQAENRRVYESSGWNRDRTSTSHFNGEGSSQHAGSYGTGVRPGRLHHYEQFQTSSSSGLRRPDIDEKYPALGGNEDLQQTQNANFDQTVSHSYGRNYRIRSGDLTTQGIDLGQMPQDAGYAGRAQSYHQYEQQRFYRAAHRPEDFVQQTEDLNQQTEDLTQQTEDLTQQTEDLTQQTQDLTQQTEDLTQQTQDLTQQTEDLTQQTQDLTQQTQDFTQQSQDLTQQTQQITQQSEDLTQQTQDFAQQNQDLTQQTQQITQQSEDLTQQTQDFAQQSQDLTQQTQQITQQSEDLTQQTQDFAQQSQDLTQQTQQITQQSEDLTQQTQDFAQQSQDLRQQTQQITQQSEDLTQQTQDFTQQSQDLSQQTQQITQQSENLSQQTQDLTQQSQDLTQQTQDLTQQVQDYTQPQDFSQQNQEITQQSENLNQQTQDLTQQVQDFTHQSQDFTQQTQQITQQSEDLTQQTQDLTQQSQDLTQQTEDLTQQTQELVQQTEDFSQQTQGRIQQGFQQDDWKVTHDVQIGDRNYALYTQEHPGIVDKNFLVPQDQSIGHQQTEDLLQQSEDLTQQTEDLTQQTEDLFQQTEDLTQQSEDLTQQTQDLTQQSEDITQQMQDFTQQSQDLTQQTVDLTQQTEDLTQQTEDLTQQTEDLTQQTESEQTPRQHVDQIGDPNYVPYPPRPSGIAYEEYFAPQEQGTGNQQLEDLFQQTEDLTQQTEDLTQQTEDLTQQTEDLTQQTEDLTQQTEDLTQQTEDLTQQTEDLSQHSGYTDDLWNQRISGSQFIQEEKLKNHERTVPQPSKPAPKPAAKPKRIRPTNFREPVQIVVQKESTPALFAESEPIPNYAQQDTQRWETADERYQHARVTSVPSSSNRGDQSFDINANEPEFEDSLIGTDDETSQVQHTDYMPSYPSPPVQQSTGENQFGHVQTTKTKTRTRPVYPSRFDRPQSWGGQREWQPPRDVTSSQGPVIRYTDASRNSNYGQTQSPVRIEQEVQEYWANGAESQPVRPVQPSRNTGAGNQAAPVVIGTRILEAYGGDKPEGKSNNPDLYASVQPNPSATFAPNSDDKDSWAIFVPPVVVPTTTTEAPIVEITTTTTTTTPATPPEPPTTTPAPSGFWNKFGRRITSTFDKAKEKAKELFG